MKLELVEETEDQLRCTLFRGNRCAFVYTVRGDDSEELLELADAIDGEDWVAQIKASKTDADAVAEFTATQTRVGNLLKVVFHADDTEDMLAGETYYFDCLMASGPLAPKTFFGGSTIYVEQDTSRETAS